jgi:hypothetical protein
MLAIEDLLGKTEADEKLHIADKYAEQPYDKESAKVVYDQLEKLDVLVAYESVGSWGCDSTSFFVFKDKETGMLYEMHGSHCSCYGFEGQFRLEQTTTEALKSRVANARSRNEDDEDEHAIFSIGGYDSDATNNARIINNYINSL